MAFTALLALVFVVFYNIFFFKHQLVLASGALFLFLNAFAFLTRRKLSPNINLGIGASFLSVIFALLLTYRSNEIVGLINILLAIFMYMVASFMYRSEEKFPTDFILFILTPAILIKNNLISLINVKNLEGENYNFKNKNLLSFIKGFGIAIPILLVFYFLFSKADPVFDKLSKNFLETFAERFILSAIIFFGLVISTINKIRDKLIQKKVDKKNDDLKIFELGIVLGSIVALFMVFIIIQFNYLFSSVGERQLHKLGITSLTYSEYVNKGFFELLIAASLSCVIILFSLNILNTSSSVYSKISRILLAVLTSETTILLISDLKRLSLYAISHGLTRARVFGFVFLVWLFTILAIFLVRTIKEVHSKLIFSSVFTVSLIGIIFLNLLNIDGIIATKYRPTVNKEVDYYYLSSLSFDAKDSWVDAVGDAEKIINELIPKKEISAEDNRRLFYAKSSLLELNRKIEYIQDKYGSIEEFDKKYPNKDENYRKVIFNRRSWQSFNLAESQAYKLIAEYVNLFNKVPGLLAVAESLEGKVASEVKDNTQLDRALEPPLIR